MGQDALVFWVVAVEVATCGKSLESSEGIMVSFVALLATLPAVYAAGQWVEADLGGDGCSSVSWPCYARVLMGGWLGA